MVDVFLSIWQLGELTTLIPWRKSPSAGVTTTEDLKEYANSLGHKKLVQLYSYQRGGGAHVPDVSYSRNCSSLTTTEESLGSATARTEYRQLVPKEVRRPVADVHGGDRLV